MLLVFVQALANNDALRPEGLAAVVGDDGLGFFLGAWVAGFYLGSLLVALALLLARATPVWVPILLVAFVVMMPLENLLGEVGQVVQLLALTVSFTGIAIAAVGQSQRGPSYATT